MGNDIGTQRSTRGTSAALNSQAGCGAMKPNEKGKDNPGDTRPPNEPEWSAPMAVPMPGKGKMD